MRAPRRRRYTKAVVLVPLTYNDGSKVPRRVHGGIRDELFDAFGGWTFEGEVEGAFRMEAGGKRVERLEKLAVVLEEADMPRLRRMVARWGTLLEQERMYLEITDSEIELVPPSEGENRS